jgi:adenylate cyclase
MDGPDAEDTTANGVSEKGPGLLVQKARHRLRSIGAAVASIAAVGAVVGGLTGYWNTWKAVRTEFAHDRQSVQKEALATPNVTPRLSLVVLPFTNLNHDPEQDYFADAITTDLTTDLGKIVGTFVIGRGTAFTYKNKQFDLKALGEELKVRWAVQGAVQRTGDQVRVNVSLSDLKAGGEVWSDRFASDRANLSILQDEVAARLARTLGLELVNAEARRSTTEQSKSPDAQDSVMRGWATLNEPRSKANYLRANELFDQALKLEPDNADALTGKATCLLSGLNFQFSQNPSEDKKVATELIERALSIRSNNAYARVTKGDLIRFNDPAASIPEYDLALQYQPNYPVAYGNRGAALAWSGRAQEAITPLQIALRLSPKDPYAYFWHSSLCVAYRLQHEANLAAAECRTAISLNANAWWAYPGLVWAYTATGHDREARDALAALQRIRPDITVKGILSRAYESSSDEQFRQSANETADSLRKAGLREE